MMKTNCEHLIDYFNDQLNEKEKSAFEEHMKHCPDCKVELEELHMLTEDLPYASEPAEPLPDMKERVLTAAFAADEKKEQDASPLFDIVQKPATDHFNEKKIPHKGKKSMHKKPAWIIGGLVAALLISLAGNVFTLMDSKKETTHEGAKEQPLQAEGTDKVLKRAKLKGEAEKASASAVLVQQKKGSVLNLQAEQLEQLQGNEVYQVWLIREEKPYRAGTFIINNNGEGAVSYPLEDMPEDNDWDAVAISREPDSTSKEPQGPVILSSEL